MEEGVTILQAIKQEFHCKEVDIRTYSPLTLAYIGDAIYDLVIRTIVVERGNTSPSKLHGKTVKYVSAVVQARMIDGLYRIFTGEAVTPSPTPRQRMLPSWSIVKPPDWRHCAGTCICWAGRSGCWN